MRPTLAGIVLSGVFALGGCPFDPPGAVNQDVTARIGISSSRGDAPLKIEVTAVDSSSKNGAIASYRWDFAGEATAESMTASHTFTNPGLYTVTLTVRDQAGSQGVATVEVRVSGGDGSGVTAVIATDVDSGPVPLTVRFDATGSTAGGDTIRDYLWEFGDGTTARTKTPVHVYQAAGSYTVTLTVTTGGGASASATHVITAGASNASLQLNGNQLATLPLASSSLTAMTFEAAFNAADGGGRLAAMGSALTVDVTPAANNVRVVLAGTEINATAVGLGSGWHRLAVTYDAANVTVYVDGLASGAGAVSAPVSVATIVVGAGFRGRLAQFALWSAALPAASLGSQPNGSETGLVGYWPMNEGGGQTLSNRLPSGDDGYLGNAPTTDAADPAWSPDGP